MTNAKVLGLIFNIFLLSCAPPPDAVRLKFKGQQGNSDDQVKTGDVDSDETKSGTADGDKTKTPETEPNSNPMLPPAGDTDGSGEILTPEEEARKKAEEAAKVEKALVTSVASTLDGFRWEFPCDNDPGTSDQCDSKAAVSVTKKIPDAAGRTFELDLRFRGVVEGMMYKNGKLEGDYFYVGGEKNDPTYNIYSIEVSSPKQIFFLNSAPNVGHNTFLIDYNANIKVDAGATIKLSGNGQNGRQISNFKKLIAPDIEPKTHFNGQFVQMNVLSVKANEISKDPPPMMGEPIPDGKLTGKIRIMPLGASFTQGVGSSKAGFRGFLHKLLSKDKIDHQFVGSNTDQPGDLPSDQTHHEGHPGSVITAGTSGRAGTTDYLPKWLGPKGADPQVITIVLGANDVDLNYQFDKIGERYDNLITMILDKKTGLKPNAIVLAGSLPINKAGGANEERSKKYNKIIAETVAKHKAKGERIYFIDIHAELTPADMTDNLHANDKGYEKTAKLFYTKLKEFTTAP